MSSVFQNPEPDHELTEFDRITAGTRSASPLQVMFAWAQEHLQQTRPDGFEIEDIGRLAVDSLPAAERERASNEFFYTYWEALQTDEETQAREADLQEQRKELRRLLGQFEDLAGGNSPVPYALLAEIARLSLPLVGSAS